MEAEQSRRLLRGGFRHGGQAGRDFPSRPRKTGLWQLFADVEMPLVPVLFHMERNGVLLDTDSCTVFPVSSAKTSAGSKSIFIKKRSTISISTHRSSSASFFSRSGSAQGAQDVRGYSTDASVLEELRLVHPIIGLILDYRQLAKLKSTYIDALPELVT